MRISDWSSDVCSSDLLDQRFGHARVDAVMAHLVADAVGAPAEREFGKIAGADHQPLMPVGEPEQVIGAEPRLHILEGGDRKSVVEGKSVSVRVNLGGRRDL